MKRLPALLLAIALLGGLAYYFFGGLEKTSIKEFRLRGVGGVNTETFELLGDLVVSNPSRVSVPFDRIDYVVALRSVNREIARGALLGGSIPAGESVLPVSIQVRWDRMLDLALTFLTAEKVEAQVDGNLQLAGLALPFSGVVDIKQALMQKVGSVLPL